MTSILVVSVPARSYPYKSRKGLAERQLRKRLERNGWQVFRGGFIYGLSADLYEPVKKRYEYLAHLLLSTFGQSTFGYLCYLCLVHHGMPDFLCYHPTLQQFKFVECKLGHERLSSRQKETIRLLVQHGFTVELHRLVEPCTKTRKSALNLANNTATILEKDLTLRPYLRKT